MDAVDAVLVDFQTQPLALIATHSEPVPNVLRSELIAICSPGDNEINRLGELDIQVGELFAQAANNLITNAGIDHQSIKAIGSHGQTIRHHPYHHYPFTLQIGDPNVIAAKTNLTTVADFRRRDIALGGQGAPLAPAFHQFVFRTAKENRIILNLGGIANVTYLSADLTQMTTGFDTGPANTLLDAWLNEHFQLQFDDQGKLSASGNINAELLHKLLNDPYFKKPPPKSTGREYFNLAWLNKYLSQLTDTLNNIEVLTTLCEFTAQSIAEAIKKLTTAPASVLICGGGLKNNDLIARIKKHLAGFTIHPTDDFGVPAKWLEAIAFAWLAYQTLNKKTGNLPSVTGAKQEAILGGVYFA